MSSISQEHLSLYASDGYVIVEGFLDVGEDIQPVMDEYAHVLDRLANQLYCDHKIADLYGNLPFGERLTKVYAESGAVHSQYFDFSLPQNGVELHDPAVWEQMWRDSRDRLAKGENPVFNRWNVTDPVCA